MHKLLLAILFQICFIILYAQTDKKISVYFDLDERSSFRKQPINQLLDSLTPTSVEIIGYADYLGSTAYNQKLSEDRANEVAAYIKLKSKDNIKITSIQGAGEIAANVAESAEGNSNNRRVDLVFSFSIPLTKVKTPLSERVKTPIAISESGLKPLDIDTTQTKNIVLEGVEFIPGRHYPLPESKDRLDQLLLTMKKYKTLRIEVQGFICCDYTRFDGMDNDTQTMNLSENRAKFIYDFLIREGIDADRVSYKGYGSSKPKVFPEETEEDRQANRRVEIKILK